MKKFVIANWKMNPGSLKEAKNLFNSVNNGVKNLKNIRTIICPPFIYISELAKLKSNIKIGAQNCFWEDSPSGGAFTGEVSVKQLKNLGCEYIIIGHSERKKYLGETNDIINKKIKSTLKYNLIPIFLFGETTKEKEQKLTKKSLTKQIKEGLKGIKKNDLANIILAYDPAWAIGGKSACSAKEAYSVNLFLKNFIAKEYSVKLAETMSLLYGGSVSAKNAESYITEAMTDGVLAGTFSLIGKEFVEIAKNINNTK